MHNFTLNRAILSFVVTTTDKKTIRLAATILEDYRLRATFALSTGTLGVKETASSCDILSLSKKNHEIALQTHRGRTVNSFSENCLNLDMHRSIRDIQAMTGIKPAHFTYPQGIVSFANKFRLGKKMRSSLSTFEGVNQGVTDLHCLKSSPLHNLDDIKNYINKTKECRGFLIFRINNDTSEAMFRYAIEAALLRGISIYTIKDALDFAGVPKLSNRYFGYSKTPDNNEHKNMASHFGSPVRVKLQ